MTTGKSDKGSTGLVMSRNISNEERQEILYRESVNAQNRAKEWWKGKPDPRKALGQLNCWKCCLPILDKEGTSLIDLGIEGEQIFCADCTRHISRSISDLPRTHSQQAVKPSKEVKKAKLEYKVV